MSLFDEGELDPDDPLVRARMMAVLEQQNAPERDLALTMKTGASTRPWRKPHREQFDRREPVHFFDVAGHTIRYTDEASLGHSGEIAKTGRLVWDAALGEHARWLCRRVHLLIMGRTQSRERPSLPYPPPPSFLAANIPLSPVQVL